MISEVISNYMERVKIVRGQDFRKQHPGNVNYIPDDYFNGLYNEVLNDFWDDDFAQSVEDYARSID